MSVVSLSWWMQHGLGIRLPLCTVHSLISYWLNISVKTEHSSLIVVVAKRDSSPSSLSCMILYLVARQMEEKVKERARIV